jgi:hypothetical protein
VPFSIKRSTEPIDSDASRKVRAAATGKSSTGGPEGTPGAAVGFGTAAVAGVRGGGAGFSAHEATTDQNASANNLTRPRAHATDGRLDMADKIAVEAARPQWKRRRPQNSRSIPYRRRIASGSSNSISDGQVADRGAA